MDWKPIESAPRDGTQFLGYEMENYCVCWFERDDFGNSGFCWGWDNDYTPLWTWPSMWCEIVPPDLS
jgi:hypothetical protein